MSKLKIGNILKLANFLDALPQKHFKMDEYRQDNQGYAKQVEFEEDRLIGCGTIGCALGWTPWVPDLEGDPLSSFRLLPSFEEYFDWASYGDEVLGIAFFTPEWKFCFSGLWSEGDNTPTGAANRLRYIACGGKIKDLAGWSDSVGDYFADEGIEGGDIETYNNFKGAL